MTSEDATQYDVIFFYGPPHGGKTLYYWKYLQHSHVRVSPEEEFSKHAEFNLRQLIFNKIVPHLKDGKRIVIDDCNWSTSRRTSYISLISKKIPWVKFLLLQFNPEHEKDQLYWTREYQIAECLEVYTTEDRLRPKLKMVHSDMLIERWFNKVSGPEYPEPPDPGEGYVIDNIKTQLSTQAAYMLEVPGMLIQWESLVKLSGSDVSLIEGVSRALSLWGQGHPAGRIIVISDNQTQPTVNIQEKKTHIEHILKQLTKHLMDTPVYLLNLEDMTAAGSFAIPPSPGLLIFLQRLHHLSLPNTVMLYMTVSYRKMAERAGIKHIQAKRVFERPSLISSTHGMTCVPEPSVFRNIRVLPPCTDKWHSVADIPLYTEATQMEQTCISYSVGHGRTLYLAYKDKGVLERYQELYKNNASTVGSITSRVLNMKLAPPTSLISGSVEPSGSVPIPPSSTTRALPTWMGSNKLQNVKQKTKPCTVDTVYIISETELVDTATAVLSEAGEQLPTMEEIAANQQIEKGDTEQKETTQQCDRSLAPCLTAKNSSHTELDLPLGSVESSAERLIDKMISKSSVTKVHVSPRRKRRGGDEQKTSDCVLKDILGDEDISKYTTKRPPKRVRDDQHCSENKEVFPQHQISTFASDIELESDDDDFNVPDIKSETYVKDTSSDSSVKSSKPSLVISESLVEETSSETSKISSKPSSSIRSFVSETASNISTKSSKPSIIISDSLKGHSGSETSSVYRTESLTRQTSVGSTTSSKSSKPSLIVSDSFVTDTGSDVSSRSSKPSLIAQTSFVSDTSSNQSRSSKPSLIISDSFVSGSSSSSCKSLSTHSGLQDTNEAVPSSKAYLLHKTKKDSFVVPESFVPDTVTTVPDSEVEMPPPRTAGTRQKRGSKGEQDKPRKTCDSGPDYSVLEGII